MNMFFEEEKKQKTMQCFDIEQEINWSEVSNKTLELVHQSLDESVLCMQCGHVGVKNETKTGKNHKYGQ